MKFIRDGKKFFEDAWRKFSSVEKFVAENFCERARRNICALAARVFAQCDDDRIANFSFAFFVRRSVHDFSIEEHSR